MIRCGHCGQNLPPDDFAPSRRRQGNTCRDCMTGRVRDARIIGQQLVTAEKLQRGSCVDCGLVVTPNNVVVFDFDHRDRLQKQSGIGRLKSEHSALLAELDKCDLRCANCHRMKTFREREHMPLLVPKVRAGRAIVACACCGTAHSRHSRFCSRRCSARAAYRERVGIPLDVAPFTVRAAQLKEVLSDAAHISA